MLFSSFCLIKPDSPTHFEFSGRRSAGNPYYSSIFCGTFLHKEPRAPSPHPQPAHIWFHLELCVPFRLRGSGAVVGSASLLSFFYSLKNVTQRYLNLKMQFFFPGPPHRHSLTTCSVHPLANCQPQRLASCLISSIPAPRLLSILEEKQITGLMTLYVCTLQPQLEL